MTKSSQKKVKAKAKPKAKLKTQATGKAKVKAKVKATVKVTKATVESKAKKKTTTKKAVIKKTTTKKTSAKKAHTKKAATKKATTKRATAKKVKPMKKSEKKPEKKIEKNETKKTSQFSLPALGTAAPDFTLTDQNGQTVTLSELKGKNVVIYFYPRAMTPGCTVQACSLRDSAAELSALNITVLGISGDPISALKKFEQKDHLNFTLLSDPDLSVAKTYGSFGQKSFMGKTFDGLLRQSYFLDSQGVIRKIMTKVDTKTHHQDVIDFYKNLSFN